MLERRLQALIADDETACRETLIHYLQKYCPQVECIGEASDVPNCVAQIQQLKPDLVFLDVEMPFGNAFDVLEQTAGIPFQTIFVTAFSEYALRALNSSAAYYLLKPLNINELIKAVEKVQQAPHTLSDLSVLRDNLGPGGLKKLLIPTLQGAEVLKLDEVLRFSGNGNYTDIYLRDGRKKTVSRVLRYFDELLEGQGFMRVHKSHLVRLGAVQAWHRGKGGYAVLEDGSEIEVSPSKKDLLLARLGQQS